ncbi:MAG TPA: M48 family metalloprotease [Longimicrobium sp.]|nr:M48 family metalloprotease [Longimicrobium sp.]
MQDQELAPLARRYGELARRDPRAYRWRIIGLTALGYGYIVGALVVLVGVNGVLAILLLQLHALGVAAKLLVLQAAAAWVVLRSLWVRVRPEDGIEVTRAQAPALFAMLDQVRAGIHSRPVHRVLVTDELNAALGQYPRLGVFGWWRNHLLLGFPLRRALSPEEARAVIAHELAHLSREHARSGLWAYRVRLTWRRLHHAFTHGGQHGAWLFRGFSGWYVPRLEAATLAMSRAHEFEADELAVRVAGADAAARALTRLEVLSRHAQEVAWPGFVAQSDHHPQPTSGWMTALCGALATAQLAPGTLEPLPDEEDDIHDTHPPLGARLRAIGVTQPPPEAFQPAPHDAASELLGPLAGTLQAEFDRRWLAVSAAEWNRRHNESQAEMRRLAELDASAAAGILAPREALQRAYLVSAWRDAGEARQLFAELAGVLPEARAALGQSLLESGDEAGIAHLERAAEEDVSMAFMAAVHITAFLKREGRTEEAAQYQRRLQAEAEEDALADAERAHVDPSIAVQPHTLEPAQVAELAAAAAGEPLVRRARLVRRVVRHRPQIPVHILVLELNRWRYTSASRRQRAIDRVVGQIHGVDGIGVVTSTQENLGKKAAAIPRSLIFDRATTPVPAA